jgi:hypothetical protein
MRIHVKSVTLWHKFECVQKWKGEERPCPYMMCACCQGYVMYAYVSPRDEARGGGGERDSVCFVCCKSFPIFLIPNGSAFRHSVRRSVWAEISLLLTGKDASLHLPVLPEIPQSLPYPRPYSEGARQTLRCLSVLSPLSWVSQRVKLMPVQHTDTRLQYEHFKVKVQVFRC